MKPFMFVIHSVPSPNNRFYASVAKAIVHIWVMDITLKDAENKAIQYIKDYKWVPKEIEHAFEIEPQQLDNLHEAERILYNKALLHGISADYIASPIKERDEKDPILHLPLDVFQ